MISITVICIVLTSCSRGDVSTIDEFTKGKKLVWSDEFDYEGLPDPKKWSYDVGGHGWGNQELQYYTEKNEKNAFVKDGKLVITARKEKHESNEYTSARLVTKGKGDWLYGTIQIRAKLPQGTGIWSALWMLPTENAYGSWPKSGEIDILEYVGIQPDFAHSSIHTESFNHTKRTQKTANIMVSTAEEEFHIYTLVWSPTKISCYVDDKQYFSHDNIYRGWLEWPFDRTFHLVMNTAVGGSWGGNRGVDDSIFPQAFEIDYVRVYQGKPLAKDKEAPDKPLRFSSKASSIALQLNWVHSYDEFGVKEYEVYKDDKFLTTVAANTLSVEDLNPETEYKFKIRAVDFAGNTSEFTSASFTTNAIRSVALPGLIEAEDFVAMKGIQIESTLDSNGGSNVGWIDANDYMDYHVTAKNIKYRMLLRVASESNDGIVLLIDDEGGELARIKVPSTGGWQKWRTVTSETFSLPEGVSKVRLLAKTGGFNINWLQIK
ncbi:MAG: family 16 glycosylhydrolase, partial [Spirochaetes bacterium]|nr:family 16 glycosylhydrolase [Spirochaetota bacterium]